MDRSRLCGGACLAVAVLLDGTQRPNGYDADLPVSPGDFPQAHSME